MNLEEEAAGMTGATQAGTQAAGASLIQDDLLLNEYAVSKLVSLPTHPIRSLRVRF